MILQQTLTSREKGFATFAVLFLVGLVAFGYVKTIASPLAASVLHANAIEKNSIAHYEALTNEFNKIRENIGFIKTIEIKSKIRSVKVCLLDAKQNQVSAPDTYSSCEKLLAEVESSLQSNDQAVLNIETQVKTLEKKVTEYGVVVDEALDALQKKDSATVKSAGH